jgi:hypothetical protein
MLGAIVHIRMEEIDETGISSHESPPPLSHSSVVGLCTPVSTQPLGWECLDLSLHASLRNPPRPEIEMQVFFHHKNYTVGIFTA